MRRRLEEQLRPRRVIDAVIEISAAGALRLFHPRIAAAKVRNPGRPDLLATDRRKQILRHQRARRFHSANESVQMITQILACDQLVPGRRSQEVRVTSALGYDAVAGTVEAHSEKYNQIVASRLAAPGGTGEELALSEIEGRPV